MIATEITKSEQLLERRKGRNAQERIEKQDQTPT